MSAAGCCLQPNYGRTTDRVAMCAGDYAVKERVVEIPIHVPVDVPIPALRGESEILLAGVSISNESPTMVSTSDNEPD